MSTYYSFYAGKITTDGIFKVLGPYMINKDGEKKLTSFFWRSRSFIHWDDFNAHLIPIEDMDEEVKSFCIDGIDNNYSIGYWLSKAELSRMANDEPIRGYLPIKEAVMLVQSNYDPEVIEWEIGKPIPSEIVAGMTEAERGNYAFVSYIDRGAAEYQAAKIIDTLNEFEDDFMLNEGEQFGVIVQVA